MQPRVSANRRPIADVYSYMATLFLLLLVLVAGASAQSESNPAPRDPASDPRTLAQIPETPAPPQAQPRDPWREWYERYRRRQGTPDRSIPRPAPRAFLYPYEDPYDLAVPVPRGELPPGYRLYPSPRPPRPRGWYPAPRFLPLVPAQQRD